MCEASSRTPDAHHAVSASARHNGQIWVARDVGDALVGPLPVAREVLQRCLALQVPQPDRAVDAGTEDAHGRCRRKREGGNWGRVGEKIVVW